MRLPCRVYFLLFLDALEALTTFSASHDTPSSIPSPVSALLALGNGHGSAES